MAASSGKTIALIILVVFLALFVFSWRMSPFFIAPFGVFSSISHLVRVPDWDRFHFGPDWMRFSSLSALSLVFLIIWIFMIVWVYRDAERRGMNGVLWALLVFIGNLVGLVIYLILRSESPRAAPVDSVMQTCPKCQKAVSPSFAYCPHCAAPMKHVCPSCGKEIEEGWKACPFCGVKLRKEE
ncbi:MAG: zinc ribbon domain-containing protein [Candidatus Aminicenantes bacterium]|nr:zinc ribbon domain-containing protein [Candidatus Aminicenantes bacterium]